jgi:DNA uptake protein ComE-like DNA-binding protein
VAATAAVEVRTAASAWLRSQTEALRSEGEMKARQQLREAVAAAQKHAAAHAESQLAEQAEKLRAQAESRLEKALAAARRTAVQEGKDAYRVREDKLEREKAAIDGELAATRRQLDEARSRAEAAERRAAEIEKKAHRELELERDLRFQAVEGRLGEITDLAGGVTERVRATDIDSPNGKGSQAPKEVEPAADEAETTSVWKAEPAAEDRLSIATATVDELRALGMSGVQAKRVIDYREHSEGFTSLDQLNRMPGFSEALLAHLKDRLTL